MIVLHKKPIQIKIFKKVYINNKTRYATYNTHNSNPVIYHASLRSIWAYYGVDTVYIDFDTSKLYRRGQETSDQHVFFKDSDDRYFYCNGEEVLDLLSVDHSNDYDDYVINRYSLNNTSTRLREIRELFTGVTPQPTSTRPLEDTIDRTLIHHYHDRTSSDLKPLTLYRTEDDTIQNNTRYFGIELELDTLNGSGTPNLDHKLATRLNQILNNNILNNFCKFERDGSLSNYGVEVITQPMTYNYIREHEGQLREAMRTINSMGYSSHDNGRCGLHIHVSRTEINDDTLDNIITLFENFKNELIIFSRRTRDGMRWCKFISDTSYEGHFNKMFIKSYKNSSSMRCHGAVINNQNDATVEFRLFRGTTSVNTLLASIQLVDNIITLAREKNDITNITWDDIINYNDNYNELKEYNKKRQIVSIHKAQDEIDKQEVDNRGVILIRPFQLHLEGDSE